MNIITELYNRIEKENLWDAEVSLKRNEYLKVSGSIETNLYYITSGSLKIFILDEFEEHIIRFGYENDFITALDSFISQKPSDLYIQALKKTELKSISKIKYIKFINQSTNFRATYFTTDGKGKRYFDNLSF